MNICFICGEIVSNVEFKFVLESKNASVVKFDIRLKNNSVIKVKAYNEKADYCYRKLNRKDIICICGSIEDNEIKVKELNKLN